MKTKLQSTIERILTYGLIVASILAMVYYFGTVSKRQKELGAKKKAEIIELDRQIVKAKEDLVERKERVSQIERQLAEKTKEVNDKFERLLEDRDSYTLFIEQVQRKARGLDIIIQNSTYDTPIQSSNSKYLEFKFSATVTGQYNKMKKFLWEVENAMGRLVKVGNIEIVPPVTDKQGNIVMKLTLSTFFLPN